MRRKPLFSIVVLTVLVMFSSPFVLGAPAHLPTKYMDVARIMGDWLVDDVDPVLESWASPWDTGKTDSTIAFHGIKQLAVLSILQRQCLP